MIAAAASWDNLAAEMYSAASDYGSVIANLTSGPWRGPASASMAAAATPYVSWMNATAAQAEQAADQAKAAASAYEAAFTATVPPPVIVANRALLASLVSTNILGQNTPAIAATEAHYAEMWAQDAAAMYGYAGSSSAASTLTPFAQAPATTSTTGAAAQAATVAQATGTGTQSTLSQLVTAMPAALQGLASPATSSGSGAESGFMQVLDLLTGNSTSPPQPDSRASSGADLFPVQWLRAERQPLEHHVFVGLLHAGQLFGHHVGFHRATEMPVRLRPMGQRVRLGTPPGMPRRPPAARRRGGGPRPRESAELGRRLAAGCRPPWVVVRRSERWRCRLVGLRSPR